MKDIEKNTFKIIFKEDYFVKDNVIVTGEDIEAQVLEKPRRNFFKLVLQFFTFGWYKAPWVYKVKYIKHRNDSK